MTQPMRNPLDDDQYDSNDEQIEDLKLAVHALFEQLSNFVEYLAVASADDGAYEAEIAHAQALINVFNQETSDEV